MYHEVDRTTTTENIRAGNDSPSSVEVLRRPGVVERGRLGVELHVLGVDTGTVDPGIVSVL
jgi:hypothetical protein